MDCLCCEDGGQGPASETEFLGSVCKLKGDDGIDVKFPAEKERYTLYCSAGCPFAARAWAVSAFYGLLENNAIRLVKLFPASDVDGWFFRAESDEEKVLMKSFPEALADEEPHYGYHHLRQLYEHAKPGFSGTVSVPLLWDSVNGTAVSNNSLGLAYMISTQMREMGTRNTDVDLFPASPSDEYDKHDELVQWINQNITKGPYNIVGKTGESQKKAVDEYYSALDGIQDRLQNEVDGPYLMGKDIRFADLLLWISLVRLDLAYQWRFGLGKRSVREDYPGLWDFVQRIMALPGMADTVIPRDLMAQYYMSSKWVKKLGRVLPLVPESWSKGVISKVKD